MGDGAEEDGHQDESLLGGGGGLCPSAPLIQPLQPKTHHLTQSLVLSRLDGTTAALPAAQSSQRDLAESQGEAGPVLSSRQRGAVAAPQLHRPAGRASGPQQEVEVGRGVHGVEDVGVVWDHQFWKEDNKR